MAKAYDTIESIIDRIGVRDTLIIITDIMQDKAQHILTEWQDEKLAGKWNHSASLIADVVYRLPKVPGIK